MIVKQKLKNNFTIVSNDIIKHKDLNDKAKLVAIFMASLPENWVVNAKHIANEMGYSVRVVQNAIKDLIDAQIISKIIHKDEAGKFKRGYSVIFVNNDEEELNESLENLQKCEENEELDEVAKSVENKEFAKSANEKMGVMSEVEPFKSPKNDTSKNAKKSRMPFLFAHIKKEFLRSKNLYLMENCQNRIYFFSKKMQDKQELDFKNLSEAEKDKLIEWFKFKASNGARLKIASKNALIAKCVKFKEQNESVIAIIDRAIENGWAGLFSFKKEALKKKYPKTRLGKEMEEKAILRAVLEQEPNFNGREDYDLSRVRVNGCGVKWIKEERKFMLVSA
ncbi:helix-turn-helix domain-containing protein [Campylobacter vulpis]|uniref:helix-turn-helix domain-containing protein n=1 Tax=Campylobacter vulpis TaxID=1655500 RepID=UPI000C1574C7|nr:helix-turn-helix domain-containing protein [Campylobacter vulpis]MBS4275598.1 hypothetical protein [Campylobacter vulpis]MBS4306819.1 hypothetical protein [Campylobacter vulpis]MBS4329927.1 hypothetical protein [Campylobacter vulpis]MBS4423574.1 hypothetical protein [Campylobacter vulpis]PHY89917.1 hypothetical protein AA995_07200 [Campylobacter vulpis]